MACVSVHAAVVTALPGSTAYSFGNENYEGVGIRTVAPGISWSSTNHSLFGWTGRYDFFANGVWNEAQPALSMIGLWDSEGTMTLSFTSGVRGVGALMNWLPDPPPYGTAQIAVYNSSMTLLESHTLTFSTNGQPNSGEFRGFLRDEGDITS